MHRIDGPGATVDNKFTDGDPVGGVQATVVTDDWLNAVQEEIISVLADQSIAPVKGTQNQLLTAIKGIVSSIPQATELIRGTAKVSTQAQADAGTDDTSTITPKKLRWGFASIFANNGYIVFPSWLGGLIIQWIRTTNLGSQGASSSFPLAFPTACFGVWGSSTNGSTPTTISVGAITLTTFTAYGGTVPVSFGAIAFGR